MIFPNPDKIICITNRTLCNSLKPQIERVINAGVKRIILREKDLSPDEYTELAKKISEMCDRLGAELTIHHFPDTAVKLGISNVHLSFNQLNAELIKQFSIVGCSVHSVEEAVEAERIGASYVIAGHIFATDCKKGVPPRGLGFLEEVCKSVKIPVYAIGGISPENMQSALDVGAEGVCVMSALMKI